MREGWNTYKLGSFCDFQGGSQPPKGEWIKSPKEGYVRMLQIRDFTKSRDFDIEYVRITDKLRLCKKDDILIGRYGASVGKILTGLVGAYNVAIIKTIPDESIVCKPFLRRVLEAPGFQELLGKVSTQRTAQAGFSKEDIADYEVNLPSLPEQQRIVDILDREFAKIDALKANAEKSLQAAKDLFQATLKRELEPKEGWKRKQIGDLCEIYNGGTPSTSITSYWDGGIQWITPKDMGKSKEMYVAQCERTITKEGVEHSSAKVLPVRSVIVSSRAPIGYVAINSVPMATNQGCKGFIPGKELYPEFLYYFFLSSTELLNKLGTGATFKEVSGRKLAEISLDYPAIERQQEIASHILSLSHSCSILQQNYQKTLTLCDDLKQSLLRKAFNGDL